MEVAGGSGLVRWTAPDGRWTEPDLHLFPQDGHRYEIVDGSLHVTPPLDDPHEPVVRAVVDARCAAPRPRAGGCAPGWASSSVAATWSRT